MPHDHHEHGDDHHHAPAPQARPPAQDHGAPGHDHHSHARSASTRALWLALALTAGFMVVEAAGGWLTNSLALLSDAIHMLTDSGSLVLALFAQRLALRPRTAAHTFGAQRAEILAAFINAVVLGVSSVWVIVEAIGRWSKPPEVNAPWMLGVAAAGRAANLLSALVLARGGEGNANVRAALAHVLSDAVGAGGAMLAAVAIMALGWNRADPAISIFISVLILWGSWKLVKESVTVLMEGAPQDLDVAALERTIRATPGVADLHDLHAWMISDGFPIVTVHVVLDGKSHGTAVAEAVSAAVKAAHGIDHVTVQPEAPAPSPLVQLTLPAPRVE